MSTQFPQDTEYSRNGKEGKERKRKEIQGKRKYIGRDCKISKGSKHEKIE